MVNYLMVFVYQIADPKNHEGSLKMRMTLRTEECRRRAAICAEKALSKPEEEPRRTFAELAEQWRALAEQSAYLEQYHSRLQT